VRWALGGIQCLLERKNRGGLVLVGVSRRAASDALACQVGLPLAIALRSIQSDWLPNSTNCMSQLRHPLRLRREQIIVIFQSLYLLLNQSLYLLLNQSLYLLLNPSLYLLLNHSYAEVVHALFTKYLVMDMHIDWCDRQQRIGPG
jgi:hypothetical protein